MLHVIFILSQWWKVLEQNSCLAPKCPSFPDNCLDQEDGPIQSPPQFVVWRIQGVIAFIMDLQGVYLAMLSIQNESQRRVGQQQGSGKSGHASCDLGALEQRSPEEDGLNRGWVKTPTQCIEGLAAPSQRGLGLTDWAMSGKLPWKSPDHLGLGPPSTLQWPSQLVSRSTHAVHPHITCTGIRTHVSYFSSTYITFAWGPSPSSRTCCLPYLHTHISHFRAFARAL